QGDVGDAGVEHLHEGRHDDGGGDQPGVERGAIHLAAHCLASAAVGEFGCKRAPALGLIAPAVNYQGALPVNAMVRLGWITDGTSSRLLVAEDAGQPQLWLAGRSMPGFFAYGGPWASAVNPVVIVGSSADGTAVPGPCALNCTNNRQPYSFHRGGANFL